MALEPRGSAQLARAQPEQTARDDEELDLLRPLEDIEDLRVSSPLLKEIILGVAGGAAELDATEGDLRPGASGLRLRHRRFDRVRATVICHPGGLQREEACGLELGLHAAELGFNGGAALRALIVADLDALLLKERARMLERGAADADRHRGDHRARIIEGLHHAGETLLGVDLRAAEDILLRDAAIAKAEDGGVARADTHLLIEADELHAGRALLDDEGFDGGAAKVPIERRPDDDGVGTLTGGHEDLLAVDDVFIAVEPSGRLDGGRVRAGGGLGDRHRSPFMAEALELL